MAKFRTHYDNLKVAHNAPDTVIRAAYKSLMQKYHPDKFAGSDEEALRIAKVIKQSYEILIDPVKRKEHDQWIEAKRKRKQMQETVHAKAEKEIETNHSSDKQPIYTESELYEIIAEEITAGKTQKGLMAKVFVETDGDSAKTMARYIKYRVDTLRAEQEKIHNQAKKQAEIEKHYIDELTKFGCKITTATESNSKKWLVFTEDGRSLEICHVKELQALYIDHKKFKQPRLGRFSINKIEYILLIVVILITAGINVLLY